MGFYGLQLGKVCEVGEGSVRLVCQVSRDLQYFEGLLICSKVMGSVYCSNLMLMAVGHERLMAVGYEPYHYRNLTDVCNPNDCSWLQSSSSLKSDDLPCPSR